MGFRAKTAEQKAQRRALGYTETRDKLLSDVQSFIHTVRPVNSRNRGKLAAALAVEAAIQDLVPAS